MKSPRFVPFAMPFSIFFLFKMKGNCMINIKQKKGTSLGSSISNQHEINLDLPRSFLCSHPRFSEPSVVFADHDFRRTLLRRSRIRPRLTRPLAPVEVAGASDGGGGGAAGASAMASYVLNRINDLFVGSKDRQGER